MPDAVARRSGMQERNLRISSRAVFNRAGLLVVGLALGLALVAQPARATVNQQSAAPIAWVAPPGVVQLSPCLPHMGQHWAKPEDMPMGPIYLVHEGRLIGIEYMPAQADFLDGKDWLDLTFGYQGQPLSIKHADIEFQPRGHEGFEVPHYDMHFFVTSHAEDRAITCQP